MFPGWQQERPGAKPPRLAARKPSSRPSSGACPTLRPRPKTRERMHSWTW
uniref:Alternative protein n=1 Tax=Macrostomum lignano TaxID=282301 RepID=A0A1I8FM17_9PLAT